MDKLVGEASQVACFFKKARFLWKKKKLLLSNSSLFESSHTFVFGLLKRDKWRKQVGLTTDSNITQCESEPPLTRPRIHVCSLRMGHTEWTKILDGRRYLICHNSIILTKWIYEFIKNAFLSRMSFSFENWLPFQLSDRYLSLLLRWPLSNLGDPNKKYHWLKFCNISVFELR